MNVRSDFLVIQYSLNVKKCNNKAAKDKFSVIKKQFDFEGILHLDVQTKFGSNTIL